MRDYGPPKSTRTIASEIKELETLVAALRHAAKQAIELDVDGEEDATKHNILHRTLLPRFQHELEVARRSKTRIDYMRALAHGEITQHCRHVRQPTDDPGHPDNLNLYHPDA